MSSSIDTVSSASSSSFAFSLNQTKAKQNKQNWDDLSKAVDSGDLSSAKTALETIKSNLPSQVSSPSDSTSSSSSTSDNPFAKDLQTLSDAINSGDVSAAKSALSTIQSHMKEGGQRPPPPDSSSDSSSASSTDTSSALLKLLESESSSSTSSSSDLSTLIAYLSNGSSSASTTLTGSQLTTQA